MNQSRNEVGQYRGGWKYRLGRRIKQGVAIGSLIVLVYAVGVLSPEFFPKTVYSKDEIAIEQVGKEALAEKVEELQNKILKDLSLACETKGVHEPDAAIIFDSNAQASIGRFQWQIKSVQHYVKVLYKKDITRLEAIKIAIDEDAATELTRDVLFGTKDGASNWITCSKKFDLRAKIELLNQIKNS